MCLGRLPAPDRVGAPSAPDSTRSQAQGQRHDRDADLDVEWLQPERGRDAERRRRLVAMVIVVAMILAAGATVLAIVLG